MNKKLLLMVIVMMFGLSACSLPRLVKNDPTATPKPDQPTDLPTVVVPTTAPQTGGQVVIPAEMDGVSAGALLLNETFNRTGSWNTSNEAEYGAEVADGVYRMTLNTTDYLIWSESGEVTAYDVIIDLDTKLTSGSEINNQGLICRYVDFDNFYMLTVGNDGWVEILKFYQGVQTALSGEYMNDIVDPVSNHLQGFCVGDRLTLYVNGSLGADVLDGDLTYGDVGLIIGSYDEPEVTVEFDNFVVYEALGGSNQ